MKEIELEIYRDGVKKLGVKFRKDRDYYVHISALRWITELLAECGYKFKISSVSEGLPRQLPHVPWAWPYIAEVSRPPLPRGRPPDMRGWGRGREVIEDYIDAVGRLVDVGSELCSELVRMLKPVIEDIKCTLGWEEAGYDTVCLWSDSKHPASEERNGRNIRLIDVIEDMIPELKYHIDAPFGIYINENEAEEVRKRLKKWLEGEE